MRCLVNCKVFQTRMIGQITVANKALPCCGQGGCNVVGSQTACSALQLSHALAEPLGQRAEAKAASVVLLFIVLVLTLLLLHVVIYSINIMHVIISNIISKPICPQPKRAEPRQHVQIIM